MNINFNDIPLIDSVPEQWIYRHYLKLKEPLDGRRIKVKSIFTNEKTPSMYLFIKNGKYQWKDFSSGKFGTSAVSLVKEHLNSQLGNAQITYRGTINHIRKDYENWVKANGPYTEETIEVEHFAYDVTCQYNKREFDIYDFEYWDKFGVGRELLLRNNIFPLADFQLGRVYKDNNRNNTVWYNKFTTYYCYGFFSTTGNLLKIYNPYESDFKHISLSNELLGLDTLEYTEETLLICASMKDKLVIDALNLSVETIAPISEKVIIPAIKMKDLKQSYTHVFTLFDNDATGIKAMMLYKTLYDVEYIYLPHYKDVAEFRESTDSWQLQSTLALKVNQKIESTINTQFLEFESRHPY